MTLRRPGTIIKQRAAAILIAAIFMFTQVAGISSVFTAHADTANSYTTLSSFSGHPAASIIVSGGNYQPKETVVISARQNGNLIAASNTVANDGGEYSSAINLPVKLAQGAVEITAAGQTSGLSSKNSYYVAPFTPSLKVSASDSTPYTVLGVSGSGYAPNELVNLNFAGSTTTATADVNGNFAAVNVPTPNVPAASYPLIGVGQGSGASATAYQYINGFFASASPSSYYVMPLEQLSFNGAGFAPGETVTVTEAVSGATLSTLTAGSNGGFKAAGSFTVPADYAGLAKKFVLTGGLSKATASADVTIGKYYPNVSPTAYYVMPGKTVAFNGSGFVPGEMVTVTTGGQAVASAKADTKGNLLAAAPVTAAVESAGKTVSFTLTGQTSKGSGTVSVQVGSYNPQASPSAYYALPGAIITFTGSDFAPSEVVAIFSGQQQIGSFTSGSEGTFKDLGGIQLGYDQVNSSASYKLVGASSKTPVNLTISVGQLNAQLAPSSYYVLPYEDFDISASGFAPNESVELYDGTTLLETAETDKNGAATFEAISLPPNALGSASLSAKGLTSKATASTSIGIGNYYPSLVADNYYAKPGTKITITGSGYAPNEDVTVTAGSQEVTVAADEDGTFETPITLPFGNKSTSLPIAGIGDLSTAEGKTTITLAPYTPQISPSTYYAQPGSEVTFDGSDFIAGETVTVTLNNQIVGTEKADTKGMLATKAYILPFAKSASFTVTGQTSGGTGTFDIGLAQFYAGVQLSDYYGNGGSNVVASGQGYVAGEMIALTAANQTLATVKADKNGAFSQPIKIPYAVPGSVDIIATGATSGAQATTSYTVAVVYNSIELDRYVVPVDKATNISGSGFLAGEPVTITNSYNSNVVTVNALANGTFKASSGSLSVPIGNLTLTITGQYSHTVHKVTIYIQEPPV